MDSCRTAVGRSTMPICGLLRNKSVGSARDVIKRIELKLMSDGRKCQVVLLDDRRLDILIQPKLTARDLLDMVASHFNLKEKDYFGLCFRDETQHLNWLTLERRVLDHDFPKNRGPVILYFQVRLVVESIGYLTDSATIELFFLQAKQNIFKGDIETDAETAFELAAHAVQAAFGDYTDDVTAKKHLKKLPVLPTSALQEHPSIQYCEDQVLIHYKKLAGQTRGLSIVNYMTIVERLPTYGIHYYEVKDTNSTPWWLGLSWKGIAQYDYNDKQIPRKVFPWRQLENLYFRDRKFSVEYHDPKRIVQSLSSFNLYEDAIQEPLDEFDDLSDAISDPSTQVSVSRRTFGPSNVSVYAWLGATPQLTKCIWSMAVCQHQFYLDRKQSRVKLPSVRSMSEIAADISQSTTSLTGSFGKEDLHRADSTPSLAHHGSVSSTKNELSLEELEAQRSAQREMFNALKARKEALEEQLKKKTKLLLELCLKEAELSGELPIETPVAPGEPIPQVRRRVGTAFSLDRKIVNRNKLTQEEEELAKLELEYDLQKQITQAAKRLAEETKDKGVRKKRRQGYNKAVIKLKEIQKKLEDMRKKTGKPELKKPDNQSLDSWGPLDSEPASPANSPAVGRHHIREDVLSKVSVTSLPKVEIVEVERQRRSSSSSRSSQRSASPSGGSPARQRSRGSTPSPVPARSTNRGGYMPSSVYSTRTQYRNQMYPTFSSRSQSTGSTSTEYDNIHSSRSYPAFDTISQGSHSSGSSLGHNLYNVNTVTTMKYDSADELKTPTNSEPPYDLFLDERLRSQRESLERSTSRQFKNRYGSLERNVGHHLLPQLTPSKFGSKRDSKDFEAVETYERDRYDMERTPTPLSAYDNQTRFTYDNSQVRNYNDSVYVSRQVGHSSPKYDSPRQYYEARSPDSFTRRSSENNLLASRLEGGHGDGASVRRNYSFSSPHDAPRSNPYDQRVFEKSGDIKRYDSPHEDYRGSPRIDYSTPYAYGDRPPPAWFEGRLESPPAIKPVGPRLGPYESELKNPLYESPLAAGAKVALHVSTPSDSPAVESPDPQSSMTNYSPHVVQEVSKPYEISDYYKYSERVRRQRSTDTDPDNPESPYGSNAHQESYITSPPAVSPRGSEEGEQPISPFSMFSGVMNQEPPTGPVTSPVHSKTIFDKLPHSVQNVQSVPYQPSPQMSRRPPMQRLQCEGIQNSSPSGSINQGSNPGSHRSTPVGEMVRLQSRESSFNFETGESQAMAFSQEMLAWYEDKQEPSSATLV